ncbi:hypothetical protein D3C76_1109310 [compost metagenome]
MNIECLVKLVFLIRRLLFNIGSILHGVGYLESGLKGLISPVCIVLVQFDPL